MHSDSVQDNFKIEGHGEIVGPPDLASVLAKIREAAQFKQWLELSPGELRVLVGLLNAAE